MKPEDPFYRTIMRLREVRQDEDRRRKLIELDARIGRLAQQVANSVPGAGRAHSTVRRDRRRLEAQIAKLESARAANLVTKWRRLDDKPGLKGFASSFTAIIEAYLSRGDRLLDNVLHLVQIFETATGIKATALDPDRHGGQSSSVFLRWLVDDLGPDARQSGWYYLPGEYQVYNKVKAALRQRDVALGEVFPVSAYPSKRIVPLSPASRAYWYRTTPQSVHDTTYVDRAQEQRGLPDALSEDDEADSKADRSC